MKCTDKTQDIDYSCLNSVKLDAGKYILSFIPQVTEDARMMMQVNTYASTALSNPVSKTVISTSQQPVGYNNKMQTFIVDISASRPYFNLYVECGFNTEQQGQTSVPWQVMLTNLSLVPYNQTTSLIRQTADNIQMQVNDISIKIDNKKIVLDGNTEVNGSLTLTDEEQGFILQGVSGNTYIQPKSIESYEAFSNKASDLSTFMDNIKMQLKTTIEFGAT